MVVIVVVVSGRKMSIVEDQKAEGDRRASTNS